ncbi:1abd53f6-2013-486c-9496-ec38c5974e94 [Sclerotinia trifoliorum]|uniref:1abd53f6-2013-486c-9496-ec38c5974e94 n=1 Tax=Sclerotinia trifoliorum TaxID=28548 RepID=A0A8H2W341_9HELO|nr:1abd53f6-2013-486c-9496-ec38c5974e94 [Sclerotinia trifoliorum]
MSRAGTSSKDWTIMPIKPDNQILLEKANHIEIRDVSSSIHILICATQYFDPQEDYQQTPYHLDSRQPAFENYRISRRSNPTYTPRRISTRQHSPFRVNKRRAMHDPHPRADDQSYTSHPRSSLPVHNAPTSSHSSYSGTPPQRGAAFQASFPLITPPLPPASPSTPPLLRQALVAAVTPQSYLYPVDPTILNSVDDDQDYAFLRHGKARYSGVSYVRAQKKESGVVQLSGDF